MAAYGMQAIKNSELRKFIVYSAVTSSLVVALFVYLPFLQKMSAVNFMSACIYLNSLNASVVKVVTIPSKTSAMNPAVSVPTLDYFTEKNIYYYYQKTDPPGNVKMSPLRFTWTYENPEYYKTAIKDNLHDNNPIVIITSRQNEALPEYIKEQITGYSKSAKFDISTGFFRYSPAVIIYQP